MTHVTRFFESELPLRIASPKCIPLGSDRPPQGNARVVMNWVKMGAITPAEARAWLGEWVWGLDE